MPQPILQTTLQATVQTLGNTAVIHLNGRLVRGEGCAQLRDLVVGLVLNQGDAGTIVLNLAGVDRIDAWGLGALLRLREWARAQSVSLKLMNTVDQVERILRMTGLDRVFEFCSVRDQFRLMHRAAEAVTHAAVA
jgi:anti-anti-sigma factor